MKISTRGRYAMRLMLELAQGSGGRPMLLSRLAARQQLPARYLQQLVLGLKAAGLVESARGRGGGFRLGRPKESITLLDIYRASEGDSSVVDCLDDAGACSRSGHCPTREVWSGLQSRLVDYLAGLTLADLAGRRRG